MTVRWLRTNFQNPREFLEEIGENGFSPNCAVCGVYPKEREGKNAPRLFGLMTLERRLYIVITEALLADFILKYFPEITMTFGQWTLMTHLHQVTRNFDDAKGAATSIVTNIDFEKWNSNMREPETMVIFSDFDDLFGIKGVFSRSNEVLSGCTSYLADGTITPKWENPMTMKEGIGVWRGHLGGIAGMRQKGWTIFTVIILKYVCELNQTSCELLGQGDNQVLITKY